jgi:hypothetical protein
VFPAPSLLRVARVHDEAKGIIAVVDTWDRDDRFAPFVPERATYDPEYRKTLEAMVPEDSGPVIRDTIYALFEGPYVSLGMNKEMLQSVRVPTLIMPGNNDIHLRGLAQQLHRLIPNSQWGRSRRTPKRQKSMSAASFSSLLRWKPLSVTSPHRCPSDGVHGDCGGILGRRVVKVRCSSLSKAQGSSAGG